MPGSENEVFIKYLNIIPDVDKIITVHITLSVLLVLSPGISLSNIETILVVSNTINMIIDRSSLL